MNDTTTEDLIADKIRAHLLSCSIKSQIDLLEGQLKSTNMYFKTYDIVNNKVVAKQHYDFLKEKNIKMTISLLREKLKEL